MRIITVEGKEVAICGKHEDNTIAQISEVSKTAEYTALMSDGHQGYVMSIGGVAAYDNKVSIVGVGFDIACGNCAVRTNLKVKDGVLGEYGSWARQALSLDIFSGISFGVGKKNKSSDSPKGDFIFNDPRWEYIPEDYRQDLMSKAMDQLGTVGSGNHFVDVFEDEDGFVWVGVHFGSRGLGHTIASGFMALSQNQPWNTKVPEVECLLDLSTPLGEAYWNSMILAGDYAYVGREWVARKVASIIGGEVTELVHNHHNFAWKEQHFGRDLVVIRKGSTPAFSGQISFIGGSMGDNSVIARGTGSELGKRLMCSTVHGAGRVMSRTQAKGKFNRKTGERKTEGLVSQKMMDDWLREKQVTLVGGGLDESPHAYRRLDEVLIDQGDSVEIVHTLKPHIVCMAGANDFDPYKD
jgi:tRNA-splicing ligase RtcB